MEPYLELIATMAAEVENMHSKEHKNRQLDNLQRKSKFAREAFNLGQRWSPIKGWDLGNRSYDVTCEIEYGGVALHIYSGTDDTLADMIKFVGSSDERRLFSLCSKDDPLDLPEGQSFYKITWTEDGEYHTHAKLDIFIHLDMASQCNLVPTGQMKPVMKLVCGDKGAKEASEMLK